MDDDEAIEKMEIEENSQAADADADAGAEGTRKLYWDKPHFYYAGEVFTPCIFDGNPGEAIPEGFNAVKILLDGRTTSDLNWNHAKSLALRYSEQGLKLFWEMDLGLFSGLTQPLSDKTQYASLGIAIDHFRDTLWKEFQHETIGICLFRGSADFSLGFPWDDEQIDNLRSWLHHHFKDQQIFFSETGIEILDFYKIDEFSLKVNAVGRHILRLFCADAAASYLDLLIINIPDTLQPFLLLDATLLDSPGQCAQLVSKERFDRWHYVIKGSALQPSDLAWEGSAGVGTSFSPYGYLGHKPRDKPLGTPLSEKKVVLGVCLPSESMIQPSQYAGLDEVLKSLILRKIPFRIIPETFLITDWDGLDQIIVLAQGLSFQGKRKLQGFCAAGGVVVTIGLPIGLPLEMSVEELFDLFH